MNNGIPPCWSCGLERREVRYWDNGPTKKDHTVVICKGYGQGNGINCEIVLEIMFDFWNSANIPGDNPMERFRHRYPWHDRQGVDYQTGRTPCP
jgi:hypothetical protein